MTRDRSSDQDQVLLFPGEAPEAQRLQDALVEVGCRVERAQDIEAAIAWFQACRPRLVILDATANLAACEALCRRIRRLPEGRETCLIVQGPVAGRSWVSSVLAAGATDAWQGPTERELLRARLRHFLRAARLQEQWRTLRAGRSPSPEAAPVERRSPALRKGSSKDGRHQFHRQLIDALEQAHQDQHMLAVLLMDLDRLPQIRESLGGQAGDALLRTLSERLESRLRGSQDGLPPAGTRCARLRGNEFAVLLPTLTHVQDAAKVARLLLGLLEQPFQVADQELSLTASIGIALYPVDQTDADSLLRAAAAAMTHGREEGRHGFQFYSQDLNAMAFERLTLETSLRRALERQEFVLHYQPRMAVPTRQMAGVETLIRWQHPDLGLMAPSQFIPVAEETGLILPIGQWALEEACRQARAWIDQGLPGIKVAVNLSAEQFRDPDLCDKVAQAMAAVDLPAEFLELELTESMLMRGVERTLTILHGLKQLGCSVAVDDFGTGYSSLSYLKQFPIDCLKIDRSFVRDLPSNTDDQSIATAILRMAHSLDLRVVAEGVSAEEQLDFLIGLSCDEVQGYLFSPPLPAAELPGFLGRLAPPALDA